MAKLGKGMLFSVEQAFVGREEIRAPLKTPAWEAIMTDAPLICALIALHNGKLFCYQSGLIIEWFCLICFSIYCLFLDFTKAFLLCG